MKNGFSLHTAATAPAAAKPILEKTGAAWGFVPNLHGVLAESPAALEAYAALWTLAEKTSFTPVERNIAYLAIIYENECEYCMAGHSGLSKMQGVAGADIAAIRENRPLTDERLETLRRFAAKVTRNRGVVSDADVAAFKASGFTNQSILDLLVLGAAKLISNYTNHLAETPNDAFMKGNEWKRPGNLARQAA
jgi:uncharacterized peroxidase-related enzyme